MFSRLTGTYRKTVTKDREFKLVLHDDGTLTESEWPDGEESWDGTWTHSRFEGEVRQIDYINLFIGEYETQLQSKWGEYIGAEKGPTGVLTKINMIRIGD